MKIVISESQYNRLIESEEEQKVLRIPSLKIFDVDEYEFHRLKNLYNNYGIELHKTDNFLSDFTNQETSISQILRERKDKLMREHIMNIISN